MELSDEQFRALMESLRHIAERLNETSEILSQHGAALAALESFLAVDKSPENALQVSQHIQTLKDAYLKIDPNASKRKRRAELLEMLKLIEKHGGPKQA
jgi:hypothetical protein